MKTTILMCALGAMVSNGCVDEDLDGLEGVELGEAESRLQWGIGYYDSSGGDVTLSPTSTHTCFLTGVQGSLNDGSIVQENQHRSIGVYMSSSGYWILKFRPGLLQTQAAQVVCIPHIVNRYIWGVDEHHGSSYQPSYLGNARTQCFITSIWATEHFHAWSGDYDNIPHTPVGVRIEKSGPGEPWIFKELLQENQHEQGNGGAGGVCVDLPIGATVTKHFKKNEGTGVIDVALSGSNGSQACGLSGVYGEMLYDKSKARTMVYYNSTEKRWRVKLGANTAMYATCMQ